MSSNGPGAGHTAAATRAILRAAARRAARLAAVGAFVLAPGVVLLGGVAPAWAGEDPLVGESFAGASTASPNWVLPSAPDGSNLACLTAGTPGGSPIHGCTPATDSPGSGALRFTSATTNEEGGVAYGLSVPTTNGIDVTFDSYQYGRASGADGIGFFLAAANPADPAPPTAIGQPGGALGYAANADGAADGLTYGYLGVGLDIYGNYANTNSEGTGCTDPSWDHQEAFPENVSVRGPGSGTVGYCMLNSTAAAGGLSSGRLDDGTGDTRSGSTVPVEVVINPGTTALTTPSNLTVPAFSYEVSFTPIGGPTQMLSGPLPTVSVGLGFPSSWINPATGIPYQLTFGWVGSTGADYDIHEINDATVDTTNGIPPTLGVSLTDSASGAPAFGSAMNYTVSVANQSGAAGDPGPIAVSDTLPAGETPSTSGLGGSGWSCSLTGRQVSCTNPGPLAGGGSLPPLVIPVTVTATPGTSLGDTAVASSDFSNPASGQDTVTVVRAPTSFVASANPSSTTPGVAVSLSATGLPAATAGETVVFRSGSSTLCSATIQPAGPASCTTASALSGGQYSVIANYGGDADYAASSASTSFTVDTVEPALGTVVYDTKSDSPWSATESTGAFADDTATVTGLSGFTPSGAVTYSLYATANCTGTATTDTVTLSGGTVPPSSPTARLASGGYSYQISYSGDANYNPSLGSCEPFAVAQGTPTTSTTVYDHSTGAPWSNDEATGASAYDSAAVSGAAGVAPTGALRYDLYANGSCSGSASSSDVVMAGAGGSFPASSPSATLAPGNYSYLATYAGDANYKLSTSTCELFSVGSAASFTDSVVDNAAANAPWSSSPGLAGASSYDTATVTGVTGFTPSGTVAYDLYANSICSGTPLTSDTGTLTAAGAVNNSKPSGPLAGGNYSYQASYSGDSDYLPSGGPCESFAVGKGLATIATAVYDATTNAAWSGSKDVGATAYDTATLNGTATGVIPTGTVTYSFYANGTCTGPASTTSTVTLSGGAVPHSATTAALGIGNYGYSATYSGDGSYAFAGGVACEPFAVTQAATTLSTSASGVSTAGVVGDSATLAGGSSPTGTITFGLYGPNNSSCTGAPASTSSATVTADGTYASAPYTPLLPGTYQWVASYSGDAHNLPAGEPCSSAGESVTVPSSPAVITGNVNCDATYLDTTINGNLTVPPGEDCTLIDSTVKGNVQVQQNAGLLDYDSTVQGNLQTNNSAWIDLRGNGTIDGNLQVQGDTGVTPGAVGDGSTANDLCGNTVKGNVQVQNNGAGSPFDIGSAPDCSAPLTVGGNLQVQGNAGLVLIGAATNGAGDSVHGNTQVQNNTGGGRLTYTTSGGNCQMQGDTPGVVGSQNTATGNIQGCNATD